MMPPLWRAAIIGLTLSATAAAQIDYRQNSNHQTVELSGLYADPTCSSVTLHGQVVKRDFAPDAMTIIGFVIELADGTRTYVNVSQAHPASIFQQGAIADGLQRLLKVGRVMNGRALACGAAGRVLTLEEVR